MRSNLVIEIMVALWAAISKDATSQPTALVYRGPAACDGCPESVGELLKSSEWKFNVLYVGPDEDEDLTKESLAKATVVAFPGGPDLDDAWDMVGRYKSSVRDFVSAGGHYLGFCLGAYLAGHSPGFGLLPRGADTDSEIEQPRAQVTSDKDTVIQVDWTFVSGHKEDKRWVYFQEGALIEGLDKSKMGQSSQHGKVLGTYSKTGDVAASVTAFGKGWVGLVGPHPEADQSWCMCLYPSVSQ